MLEAAIAHLETKGADDVSMAEIAESAGVSLRTLYRYFPDRAALLHAAGEHLYATLGVPFEVTGPEQISASLLDAARRLRRVRNSPARSSAPPPAAPHGRGSASSGSRPSARRWGR